MNSVPSYYFALLFEDGTGGVHPVPEPTVPEVREMLEADFEIPESSVFKALTFVLARHYPGRQIAEVLGSAFCGLQDHGDFIANGNVLPGALRSILDGSDLLRTLDEEDPEDN